MKNQTHITVENVKSLLEWAMRLGLNLRQNSLEGFVRYREISIDMLLGRINPSAYSALADVCQREEAKLAGKIPSLLAFRPQPTEADGLGNFEIKLPFTIADTNAPFSLSLFSCAGGVVFVGGLQSGKSVKTAHLLKAFIQLDKSIIGIDSKGIHEWDFMAGYPVLLLTVGAEGHDGFYFNPFTDEGGFSEILSQLDILAVCMQRKDSQGLLIHAAEHFFQSRPAGDPSQLTMNKLINILTTEVIPANHKHLFQFHLWPSLLNALLSTKSALGVTLGVEKGISFEALLRNNGSLFINTSRLTLAQEEYIIASVGWKLYETSRRVFGTAPERQTNTVLFIDECSPHLSPKLDHGQRHYGPISELILKARGG